MRLKSRFAGRSSSYQLCLSREMLALWNVYRACPVGRNYRTGVECSPREIYSCNSEAHFTGAFSYSTGAKPIALGRLVPFLICYQLRAMRAALPSALLAALY